MSLNSKYVLAQDLWELFTNKDTGQFLRNGYILFAKDASRLEGKVVYRLSGNPPDYTYVPYGSFDEDGLWRVDLNNQGAYDYNLYYYPYDEFGNVELYFAQAYSSDADVPGVFQFSRAAIPNVSAASGETVVSDNFVPNGQFLLHNNLPAVGVFLANEIRADVTEIAPGNWSFERSTGANSKDFVSFPVYGSWSSTPAANPRFSARAICTDPGSGVSVKRLALKFANVNRFSSDTQTYTFAFNAYLGSGSNQTVELVLIKNFGTGGSASTTTSLTSFNITSTDTVYDFSFTFGTNENKTIGTLNDDYVQIALNLPISASFDIITTDYLLTTGTVSSPLFPEVTNQQIISETLGGGFPIPSYSGANLYLPPLQTLNGWTYDTGVIGSIRFSSALSDKQGWEIEADGAQYETAALNALSIPYSRLEDKYWDETILCPIHGTGRDFVTQFLDEPTPDQSSFFTTNKAGVQSAATDGAIATGFTFNSICSGAATINLRAWAQPSDTKMIVYSNILGAPLSNPTAGTSGFVVSNIRHDASTNALFSVDINSIAASTLGGKYILFSNTTTSYYLWFKYNGAGSDPAVGGRTGILVNLYTGFTATNIIYAMVSAVNRFETSEIIFTAASAVTAGSYWTFACATGDFYVWYKKDGAGADPAPVGKVGIQVDLIGTDASGVVSSNTVTAINRKYFAAPDYRGQYFRVTDNGAGVDLHAATRFTNTPNYYGDKPATYELDGILTHFHDFEYQATSSAGNVADAGGSYQPIAGFPTYSSVTANASNAPGQSENNTKNVTVNVYIHL